MSAMSVAFGGELFAALKSGFIEFEGQPVFEYARAELWHSVVSFICEFVEGGEQTDGLPLVLARHLVDTGAAAGNPDAAFTEWARALVPFPPPFNYMARTSSLRTHSARGDASAVSCG